MANDDSGQVDEVHAELSSRTTQPAPVPERPAAGAAKDAWVRYVVALGADRTFVTDDTEHYDEESSAMVTLPALTKQDLIALADRLGG